MTTIEIARLIGRPFGSFSKERWRGIGSERCRIVNASGEAAEIFNGDFNRNFSNIEIRPKGILLRVRYRLEVFAIAMPFSKLEIGETEDLLLLQVDQFCLKLISSRNKPVNQNFIKKILVAQKVYIEEHHEN